VRSRRNRVVAAAGIAAALVLAVIAAAAAGAFASTSAPPASASGPARAHAPASGRAKLATTRHGTKQARRSRTLTTSCTTVGHIGDSTSVGMVSPDYLPDPAQRLAAQYADVGVRRLWVDASGGRSIVEVLPGQVNGYNVARGWVSKGFRGCWVFALGTNDTANVAVGSNIGRMARIEQMMSVAHGEPVLWVNTHTLLSAGPWSEENMEAWNNDLVQACARYPNMRIFNWAAVDQPAWHISDGIHYTSAGYAIRAADIARALARAFPRGRHSRDCVIN
jgi:lysophospholipase L1-like esterase